MKTCKNCNKSKSDEEFFIRTRDNKPYGWCKSCVTVYSKDRYRRYKQEAVNYLGGKCFLCGYNKDIAALEFHHKDRSKKSKDYYAMKNWSLEKKKKELDKCILLCANCHREVESGASFL